MTGFTAFLLEQGIETELPISLNEALGLLEEVVPSFSHAGQGYLLAAVSRAQLGSRWELDVKVTDPASNRPISDQPVGFVHVSRATPTRPSWSFRRARPKAESTTPILTAKASISEPLSSR